MVSSPLRVGHAAGADDAPSGPGDRRIFVQIPAYRDPDLGPTLEDLFAKASDPDALRVVVLWQRADDDHLAPELQRRPNLEIIDIPFTESQGCGWARNLLQQHWRGEPYTLILNSHHRFVPDWDRKLVGYYEKLRHGGVGKPVLTAYMPPFKPDDDPLSRPTAPLRVCPLERSHGLLIRVIGRHIPDWETLSAPVSGNLVSLHFLFAGGAFNREIPFDPACYFLGDEVAIGLRAFTSGYDVFHPHELIGWHCYQRDCRPTHWEDHREWQEQELLSLRTLKILFSGRYLKTYGLGRQRKLRDFEARLGMKLWDSELSLETSFARQFDLAGRGRRGAAGNALVQPAAPDRQQFPVGGPVQGRVEQGVPLHDLGRHLQREEFGLRDIAQLEVLQQFLAVGIVEKVLRLVSLNQVRRAFEAGRRQDVVGQHRALNDEVVHLGLPLPAQALQGFLVERRPQADIRRQLVAQKHGAHRVAVIGDRVRLDESGNRLRPMPPGWPRPVFHRRENQRVGTLEGREDVFFEDMGNTDLSEKCPHADHGDVVQLRVLFETEPVVQRVVYCRSDPGFLRAFGHVTTPWFNRFRPRGNAASSATQP